MAELEAMACARPVVSWYSYRGAYEEFPPFARAVDGYDIAATVARLVDDAAERQAIGEASRVWVQKFHNVAEAAERVERAALDVISGHSQRVRSSQA
jgi:glycosyltransferase involved in cell wall biosynthesis